MSSSVADALVDAPVPLPRLCDDVLPVKPCLDLPLVVLPVETVLTRPVRLEVLCASLSLELEGDLSPLLDLVCPLPLVVLPVETVLTRPVRLVVLCASLSLELEGDLSLLLSELVLTTRPLNPDEEGWVTVDVEVVCASLSLELEDDLPPLLSELPPRHVNPNDDGLPPLPLEVYSATFRRPLGMMGLEATSSLSPSVKAIRLWRPGLDCGVEGRAKLMSRLDMLGLTAVVCVRDPARQTMIFFGKMTHLIV